MVDPPKGCPLNQSLGHLLELKTILMCWKVSRNCARLAEQRHFLEKQLPKRKQRPLAAVLEE